MLARNLVILSPLLVMVLTTLLLLSRLILVSLWEVEVTSLKMQPICYFLMIISALLSTVLNKDELCSTI